MKVHEEVKVETKPLVSSEEKDRGVLGAIYDFLSSLIAGSLGIVTFAICIFTVFRHGSGLADVSFLELGFFIWLLYCFNAAKELAQEQQRSVFLFTWRLFALTGWLMFWSCLAYAAWFKWGADYGLQDNFFASSLFEVSLLLVVGIGAGLGVLVSVKTNNDEQPKAEEAGEAI